MQTKSVHTEKVNDNSSFCWYAARRANRSIAIMKSGFVPNDFSFYLHPYFAYRFYQHTDYPFSLRNAGK